MFRFAKRVLVGTALLGAFACPVIAQDEGRSSGIVQAKPQEIAGVKKWETFDFRTREITANDLKDLSLTQLKLVRGIVFGRHGRVFVEEVIQNYLKSRPWYKPDPKYRVTVLNAAERRNMDAIKEAEFKKHEAILQPGDMKFYRNAPFTDEQKASLEPESGSGGPTIVEITIMRAEIEAVHGRRFDDMPWLQKFFEERYWYAPNPKYNASELSAAERKNLMTLTNALKNKEHVRLLPGDMALFQETPITPDLLIGLSLYDLRLLRNEVYARRGKRFHTQWLQRHFAGQGWYKPLPDFRDPALSPIETKNIALIVKAERRQHEELATTLLTDTKIGGLFVEDLRKLRDEILARHGKIFPDRWRSDYFKSFAWYKPNPQYSDKALNPIERKNLALLTKQEAQAQKQADFTPA